MDGSGVVYGERFVAQVYVARRPWARVLRAIDDETGQPVALSVASPETDLVRVDVEHVAAVVDELDGLAHPNLAPVLAFGTSGEVVYLAERWVEGPSLAEVVASRGHLQPGRVAAVLDDLARGLGAAHAHGVVHGGPSPADVTLDGGPGGGAVLGGFVLQQAALRTARDDGDGRIVGDRPYLAPERLAGGPPTVASDLYGLGAVAFDAIAGRPPFERSGRPEGQATPWPSSLVEGVPEDLEDLVLDLLEPEPGDRYADAPELLLDVEAVVARSGSPRPPTPPSDRAGEPLTAFAAEALGDDGGEAEAPAPEVAAPVGPDGEAEAPAPEASAGVGADGEAEEVAPEVALDADDGLEDGAEEDEVEVGEGRGAWVEGDEVGEVGEVATDPVGEGEGAWADEVEDGAAWDRAFGELADTPAPGGEGEPAAEPDGPADEAARRHRALLGAGGVLVALLLVAGGLLVLDRRDDGPGEAAADDTTTTEATDADDDPDTSVAEATLESTSTSAPPTTAAAGAAPVPDTVGTGLFQAAEQLSAAGFSPQPELRIDPTATPGFVVEQDPPGGSTAAPGSAVRIVYAEPG